MIRYIIITLFIFYGLIARCQEGIYYVRVGEDFSIKFVDYTLELCSDEVYFSKENDSTYRCSEYLDYTELAQDVKLKIKVPFDSVSFHAGYVNRYGVSISETEGALIYRGDEKEASLFSGWRKAKVLDKNRKYNLWFFDYHKGFVNNDAPAIDKSVVKDWCKQLDWCPSDEVSVYCAEMILRIRIYNGASSKVYYLKFDRRIGEC